MARVFVTGSADGLGLLAARSLCADGHAVVMHGRNQARADDAMRAVPGAEAALAGDLSDIADTRRLAERANASGAFDAVIHNAAIGFRERRRIETADGLPHVFAVNTLAPYVLTALMRRPARLIYVSSELHRRGDPGLDDLDWTRRAWNGNRAYCDSKLHDVLLSCAVARRWPDVLCNALEPGWVPTKLGGPRATGDLDAAHRTQTWLAVGDDPAARVSGGYFYHRQPRRPSGATADEDRQDRLVEACTRLSGIVLPD